MSSHNACSLLTAAVLLQVVAVSWADVTISIQFLTFKNPTGRDGRGQKCDLANRCDHFFEICIDRFGGDRNNVRICPYGYYRTQEFPNSDVITFDHDLHSVQNPILASIPETEVGVLLKVRVWDDDSWDGRHDFVAHFSHKYERGIPAKNARVAADAIADVGETPHTVLSGGNSQSLSVRFLSYCTRDFYLVDDGCPKYCKPRNNRTGHYTCNDEGDLVCRRGWLDESTNCTTNEVSCLSHDCKNKGRCTGGRAAFICNCTENFRGPDCSEDVDECANSTGPLGVCHEENTERCENTHGGYICHCKPGFYKDRCQFSRPDGLPRVSDQSSAGGRNNNGMIIGLVVGLFILILLVVIILALLLRERRKRLMKEQGTNATVDTGNMGQQTGPMTTDMATVTYSNGQANRGTSTDQDNLRNQATSQTQTANGVGGVNGVGPGSGVGTGTSARAKMMEAGFLQPPSYTESEQFNNPSYGETRAGAQRGAAAGLVDNHVYDVPSLQKKY